jgi:DNA-binding CsgD family transcriptional regulator
MALMSTRPHIRSTTTTTTPPPADAPLASPSPGDTVAQLTTDDVSGVIRLVREVTERWDDPVAWREHLLHGACALVHGNVGTMIAQYDGRHESFGRIGVVAAVGVPAELRAYLEPAVSDFSYRSWDDASSKGLPGMTNLYGEFRRQGGWVTASRNHFTDDATRYAGTRYQQFRRRLNTDDYVISIRIVDLPQRAEAIAVDRPFGAPRFGPREVALLKILHDEIAPLVGVRLTTEAHLSRDGLSTRLRETLSLLLDGLSEKQVARRMHLSTGTVHEYVGVLYKHFRVSSRGELLAYFVRRTPAPRA